MKHVFIFAGLSLGLSAVTEDVLPDCGLKADGSEAWRNETSYYIQ